MNKTYTTSDTAESAYLIAHGIQFKSVEKDKSDPKVTIVLEERTEGEIGELLIPWDMGDCPEKNFFLKYKWLLRQVAPKNGNKN
jgi:hypothetical protein